MKNQDQYPNADRQIMLRDTAQQHLPSTEVRELVPDYEDEIDLRDLLDVLLRRKWTVITILLVCFFTAVLVTFSMTPQFKASGSLKVSAQAGNLTKFDNVDASALKTMEFQQTQVKMLQSEQLASRVIATLELANNKVFIAPDLDVECQVNVHGLTQGLCAARRSRTKWLTAEWISVKHV